MTDLFDMQGDPAPVIVKTREIIVTPSGVRALVLRDDALYAAWKSSPLADNLKDWIKANRPLIEKSFEKLDIIQGDPT